VQALPREEETLAAGTEARKLTGTLPREAFGAAITAGAEAATSRRRAEGVTIAWATATASSPPEQWWFEGERAWGNATVCKTSWCHKTTPSRQLDFAIYLPITPWAMHSSSCELTISGRDAEPHDRAAQLAEAAADVD
jgi:hypothetical protein